MGMMDHSKKSYIFDLDGTLVDAYKGIQASLNYVLTKLGRKPVSLNKVKRSVGRGDELFIKQFFPDNNWRKALSLYRQHHKDALVKYVTLRPGAKRLLSRLKKRDKFIGVASNRPTPFSQVIIEKLGLDKYIDYMLCADRKKHLKPAPYLIERIMEKFNVDRKETVFVGDMAIDAQTAKNAEVDFIFIKGGSSCLKELKGYKKKVVNELNDILRLYE